MYVCKLKSNDTETRPIEKAMFDQSIFKKEPWVQKDGQGKVRNYAVCPACDNPVRIIGLYHPLPHTERPYGRHTGKPIDGFPEYDPEAYEWCPYAKARRTAGKGKKRRIDGVALKILATVLEQFDRIIYVIEQDTGLMISQNLARKMLQSYLGGDGYRYTGATLRNIPWIFAYMSNAKSIFGQIIVDNEDLKRAIRRKIPGARVDERGRIVSGEKFYGVSWTFILHQASLKDGRLSESVLFDVLKDAPDRALDPGKVIYGKRIAFRPEFFERLVNLPAKRARRNERLLELAEETYREALGPSLLARMQNATGKFEPNRVV